MEINKGDYINGEKIIRINEDPFVPGQINIWVDKVEIDRSLKVYRIRKEEK